MNLLGRATLLAALVASSLGCGEATVSGRDEVAGREQSVNPSPTADRSATTVATGLTPTEALAQVGLRPLDSYRQSVLITVPFESLAEAEGWYVTPKSRLTHQELSGELVHQGRLAHKAWVTGANTENTEIDGPNHRGYPTIQLYKYPRGCVTPCLLDLWVWADIPLRRGEWWSAATITASTSNAWVGQLVNVGTEGWLHTMHVPAPGQSERVYQRSDVVFPARSWVHVRILVDYRASGGGIALWQDSTLVSVARIDPSLDRNGQGVLNQAHFGLYTPPSIASGVIYNDILVISEMR